MPQCTDTGELADHVRTLCPVKRTALTPASLVCSPPHPGWRQCAGRCVAPGDLPPACVACSRRVLCGLPRACVPWAERPRAAVLFCGAHGGRAQLDTRANHRARRCKRRHVAAACVAWAHGPRPLTTRPSMLVPVQVTDTASTWPPRRLYLCHRWHRVACTCTHAVTCPPARHGSRSAPSTLRKGRTAGLHTRWRTMALSLRTLARGRVLWAGRTCTRSLTSSQLVAGRGLAAVASRSCTQRLAGGRGTQRRCVCGQRPALCTLALTSLAMAMVCHDPAVHGGAVRL